MLRITRDKAEFGSTPFITFKVYRSPKDKRTVYGYHEFRYASGNKVKGDQTPLGIPVAQAFETTCRVAESSGIAAIWVDDPQRLFDLEQSW
jgi:hypothetical protein